jgi:multiple antibiotic resistance protein
MDATQALRIAIGLLAVMNPVGAVPLFLAITRDQSASRRRRTALIAATGVAVILLVSMFFGSTLLTLLGISIHSLRVGGGLVVLLLGLAMVNSQTSGQRSTPDEHREAVDADSVAIVPMAIPILSGPGTISLIITHSGRITSLKEQMTLAAICLACAAAVYLVLHAADGVARRMGTTGINVATRIFGLVLMAIAVEMIAAGIRGLFPTLTT